MVNTKDILSQLKKFDISQNQGLIYLTLIKKGELTIQDITNETSIPRSSVYENLKGLYKLGLIEKIVDYKSARIKAYPISLLRHGLNEQELKIRTLISDLEHVEKNIDLISKKDFSPYTIVRYYKDLSAGRQLFWNTLNAKGVVYVYSSYGRSKFVGKKFYKDFAQESKERGIKERVLINPTQKAINLIKRDSGTPLARTKVEDLRFLPEESLVIKGETLIYDNIFAQINLSATGISGFEIESEGFTEMQRSIFETFWKTAKPVISIL